MCLPYGTDCCCREPGVLTAPQFLITATAVCNTHPSVPGGGGRCRERTGAPLSLWTSREQHWKPVRGTQIIPSEPRGGFSEALSSGETWKGPTALTFMGGPRPPATAPEVAPETLGMLTWAAGWGQQQATCAGVWNKSLLLTLQLPGLGPPRAASSGKWPSGRPRHMQHLQEIFSSKTVG